PRVAAASMALEGPCPDEGDAACAASPMITARPRRHTGTRGRSKVFHGPSTSSVARMIPPAGIAAPANGPPNGARHSAAGTGPVGCLLGGLANHHTEPSGATLQ